MLPPNLEAELSNVIYATCKRPKADAAAIVHAVRPLLTSIWQDWYSAATMLDEAQDARDKWRRRAETAEAKLKEQQP